MRPSITTKPRPSKKELARWKAMEQLGLTPHAIGKKTGRDGKTVRKWLASEVYMLDEDLQRMVTLIKERELSDLYLLGAKARTRLHELLDEGNTKVIETVALMDRSFQQRRALEGNVSGSFNFAQMVVQVHENGLFTKRQQPSAKDIPATTVETFSSQSEDDKNPPR